MAYSLQNFTLNQVLTAAQMNQVEESIRDHTHGRDGVGGSGVSWNYSTQSAGFSATQADSGKHFLVSPIPYSSGTLVVDINAIASLGVGWSATFTNVGSRGCVLLDPSGTEKINSRSEFCIGLGETVVVHSDGTSLRTFGNPGMKLIHTEVGSSGGTTTQHLTVSYNVAWDSFEFLRVKYGYKSTTTDGSDSYRTKFGGCISELAPTSYVIIAVDDWVHAEVTITQPNTVWAAGATGMAYVGSDALVMRGLTGWPTAVLVGAENTGQRMNNLYVRIYGENHGNVIGADDGPTLTL